MFYIMRIYDKSSCSYQDSAIVRFCTIDYIRYGNSGDKYLFYVFDTNDFSYEIVDINVIMKAIEKQVVIEGISIMEDRNSIYGSLYIKPAVIPMDNLFMCKCYNRLDVSETFNKVITKGYSLPNNNLIIFDDWVHWKESNGMSMCMPQDFTKIDGIEEGSRRAGLDLTQASDLRGLSYVRGVSKNAIGVSYAKSLNIGSFSGSIIKVLIALISGVSILGTYIEGDILYVDSLYGHAEFYISNDLYKSLLKQKLSGNKAFDLL